MDNKKLERYQDFLLQLKTMYSKERKEYVGFSAQKYEIKRAKIKKVIYDRRPS